MLRMRSPRPMRSRVAALQAPLARHETGAAQIDQDGLEEFLRHPRRLRDPMRGQRLGVAG
jgi:hypothetical protein